MRNNTINSLLVCCLLTACQPLIQDRKTATPPPPAQCTATPEAPVKVVQMPCPVCKACPKVASVKPPLRQNQLITVGAIEEVNVEPPGLTLSARIDTGAKSTSIHAENVVKFEREGQRWVSFDLQDAQGKIIPLKLPVVRRVRITQANGEIQRRYVVEMRVTLGTISEKVDITLADRSELEHPVLIGRNFLVDTAIVDVSKKHTQK